MVHDMAPLPDDRQAVDDGIDRQVRLPPLQECGRIVCGAHTHGCQQDTVDGSFQRFAAPGRQQLEIQHAFVFHGEGLPCLSRANVDPCSPPGALGTSSAGQPTLRRKKTSILRKTLRSPGDQVRRCDMPPLTVTEHSSGDVRIFVVSGHLVAEKPLRVLESAIAAAMAEGARACLLDLQAVDYIDSAGIGTLVAIYRDVTAR